jgi:Starter unit:ACP transacylase in aflatoxin biosynthesis
MALQSKVILFGDQTVDPCPLIRQLWRSSSYSTTVQAFFEKTADGLRQELALAQVSDRSNFPSFHSIPSLVEAYAQSHEPDVAVATVLLCIYQLALLLTYALQ